MSVISVMYLTMYMGRFDHELSSAHTAQHIHHVDIWLTAKLAVRAELCSVGKLKTLLSSFRENA